jgi:hypothetical protein
MIGRAVPAHGTFAQLREQAGGDCHQCAGIVPTRDHRRNERDDPPSHPGDLLAHTIRSRPHNFFAQS